MSRAKSIMFQGTGSGVGKSIVTAAMCRLLSRMGAKVAPFKAQNMALNSFVTADGKEMGRAQVFQAEACGLFPDVNMNPVLLKPSADARSQVILLGIPQEHLSARDYYKRSKEHWRVVRNAYENLAEKYDVIVIEGAGSPAEINLRDTDIVNMKMAEYAGASVVIVSDIDRGGVFASLKGTYDLVEERYRHLIKGFLINRFRGDVSLLMPGIEMFSNMVPVPVLGVLPWFKDIHVDEEDGVFVRRLESKRVGRRDLRVCVVRLPRISNFTDFSPICLEQDVEVVLSSDPKDVLSSDIVILPGTKATTSDLEFLVKRGWRQALDLFVREARGVIVGICGGFQMLGETIVDEYGTDGEPGTYHGFGLLPIETQMSSKKVLTQIKTTIFPKKLCDRGIEIEGYEIHMGKSTLRKGAYSETIRLLSSKGSELMLFDAERGVLGTYIHGVFDNDLFRRFVLNLARKRKGLSPLDESFNYKAFRRKQFDLLADWLLENCDTDKLLSLVGL